MHIVTRTSAARVSQKKGLTLIPSNDAAFKRTNFNCLAAHDQLSQGDGSKATPIRLSSDADPLDR